MSDVHTLMYAISIRLFDLKRKRNMVTTSISHKTRYLHVMRTKNLLPSYVDSINNITRLVVVDVNKIKDLIDKILF